MDKRNFNRNPNHRRKNNGNDRRNDNGSDNSQKEAIKEHFEEFKEPFVKSYNLESSYIVLEEQYFDAPEGKLKSKFIFDSSYLN